MLHVLPTRNNAGLIQDTQGLLQQGISTITTNLAAGFEKGYAKMDETLSAVEASRVLLNKTHAAVRSNGEAIDKVSKQVTTSLDNLARKQLELTDFYVSELRWSIGLICSH